MSDKRGTVLITGVGRSKSIGASLALGLAEDGWGSGYRLLGALRRTRRVRARSARSARHCREVSRTSEAVSTWFPEIWPRPTWPISSLTLPQRGTTSVGWCSHIAKASTARSSIPPSRAGNDISPSTLAPPGC